MNIMNEQAPALFSVEEVEWPEEWLKVQRRLPLRLHHAWHGWGRARCCWVRRPGCPSPLPVHALLLLQRTAIRKGRVWTGQGPLRLPTTGDPAWWEQYRGHFYPPSRGNSSKALLKVG